MNPDKFLKIHKEGRLALDATTVYLCKMDRKEDRAFLEKSLIYYLQPSTNLTGKKNRDHTDKPNIINKVDEELYSIMEKHIKRYCSEISIPNREDFLTRL